jgi:HTH-type transcriptional regulator / antitoxin HigA
MRALKPIKTEHDHRMALKEMEGLWGHRLGTPKGDRLDVLATLVDVYESVHHPVDPPDPIEAIKCRMEQQGLVRKDLESLIGTRTRVAEVLNRRRPLSIAMIRRVHKELKIPAEILIRPAAPKQGVQRTSKVRAAAGRGKAVARTQSRSRRQASGAVAT